MEQQRPSTETTPSKRGAPLAGGPEEEAVRQTLEKFTRVHREGKLKEVMEFFSPDLIAFDMMPPLQLSGKPQYQAMVDRYFVKSFEFPVRTEWRELKTHVSGDLAIAYGLFYVAGTFKENKEKLECWLRSTIVLGKKNGKWLIEHVHNSVPSDEEGKILMDLKPGKSAIH